MVINRPVSGICIRRWKIHSMKIRRGKFRRTTFSDYFDLTASQTPPPSTSLPSILLNPPKLVFSTFQMIIKENWFKYIFGHRKFFIFFLDVGF